MKHNPKRFSILTLLLVVTWLAAMFGGYYTGFDVGFNQGLEEKRLCDVKTVSYPVGHLVVLPNNSDGTGPDFENLLALIENSIDPDSWLHEDVCMSAFEPSLSLIVSQTGANHDAIKDMLSKLDGMASIYKSRAADGLCVVCGSSQFDELESEHAGSIQRYKECKKCRHASGYTSTLMAPDNNALNAKSR